MENAIIIILVCFIGFLFLANLPGKKDVANPSDTLRPDREYMRVSHYMYFPPEDWTKDKQPEKAHERKALPAPDVTPIPAIREREKVRVER